MYNTWDSRSLAWPFDENFTKAFDRLWDGFGTDQSVSFPPHDVYTEDVKGEDGEVKQHLFIRLAVAGVTKDQLNVTFDQSSRMLTVEKAKEDEVEGRTYKCKGIAGRKFVFKKMIHPDLALVRCSLENGCLLVEFKNVAGERQISNQVTIE
jgi:HSP20 family molecular chaperone IbpA